VTIEALISRRAVKGPKLSLMGGLISIFTQNGDNINGIRSIILKLILAIKEVDLLQLTRTVLLGAKCQP